MTRTDVTVGVAAAVAAVFAVGAFLLVVAAGRADRRERQILRAARVVSAEAAARSVTDPGPAVGAHRERPRVPAQYPPPAPEAFPARSLHASPLDPARTEQLLAEISDALAAAGAAAPVESVAPAAAGCCGSHDPIACRRFAPCCGTCPTLPVS